MTKKLREGLHFFRQWLRDPLATASVMPSSKFLARLMVDAAGDSLARVIELGPGTGVFTRELLERGLPPEQLMLVELNGDLAETLKAQFPQCVVCHADARALSDLVASSPGFDAGGVDVVISGLGFLSMPQDIARDIVTAVFAVLAPGGRLVTFTYGPKPSLASELRRALNLHCTRERRELRNVPPARVYVYTRASEHLAKH